MSVRNHARLSWLLLVLSLAASTSAVAQAVSHPASPDSAGPAAPTDSVRSWSTMALSLESLTFLGEGEGTAFALVSLHITGVSPGRTVGPEMSLGLSPRVLLAGCAAGIIDGGVTMSSGEKTSVLMRAGVSGIGAACGSGFLGAYAGASVLLPAGPRLAVRLDATPRLALVGELVPLVSFGIGLSQLPPSLRGERSSR